MMTTTVAEDNKVAVPPELAADLGIKPGAQLDWKATDKRDTLIVTLLPDRAAIAASLQGAGRKYLKPGQDPIRELTEQRVREDVEREDSL